MGKIIKEVLEAINCRFPIGRHSSRLILMINGEIEFDYEEVLRHLNDIIIHGGSDKNYNETNDKVDANFYIVQLNEAIAKTQS